MIWSGSAWRFGLMAACLGLFCTEQTSQQQGAAARPIAVKVVVIAAFERGEDTGDAPGEFQLWVEREHLDQVLELPAGYRHVRMNKDGVLGMVTGVATAKAAASVMALGLDPRFDLSKAYWIVAGIGGGDPADVSLGSAVWAEHVIDGDLAFEIDARQIPENWPTGYVPLRKGTPYEQPVRSELEGEVYTLNAGLVRWALQLARDVTLADSNDLRKARTRFTGFPNAVRAPFVARGDTMSASTFWHGSKMEDWANQWTKYYTRRQRELHGCGDGRLGDVAVVDVLEPGRAGGSTAGAGVAHREQLRSRSAGDNPSGQFKRHGIRKLLGLSSGAGSCRNRRR
jgi:purine nucleoside permease